MKTPLNICLQDELDWINGLLLFVEKRKDEILISWVNDRKQKIQTKIQKLNEQ